MHAQTHTHTHTWGSDPTLRISETHTSEKSTGTLKDTNTRVGRNEFERNNENTDTIVVLVSAAGHWLRWSMPINTSASATLHAYFFFTFETKRLL